MRPLVTFAACVATLASCNVLETNVVNDRTVPLAELASRKSTWEGKNVSSYDFNYEHDCDCPPAAQQLVRIEVRSDQVFRVLDADGGEVTPVTGVSWPTVDSLFLWARQRLEDPDYAVQVTFDSTFSFPTRLRTFLLATQTGLDDHVVTNWEQAIP